MALTGVSLDYNHRRKMEEQAERQSQALERIANCLEKILEEKQDKGAREQINFMADLYKEA